MVTMYYDRDVIYKKILDYTGKKTGDTIDFDLFKKALGWVTNIVNPKTLKNWYLIYIKFGYISRDGDTIKFIR